MKLFSLQGLNNETRNRPKYQQIIKFTKGHFLEQNAALKNI